MLKGFYPNRIFIFLHLHENLPITLWLSEGVGSGLLIVSSDYGPMKEILGDTVYYFDPLKPRTLIDAILKTIDLPLEIKNKNLKELNGNYRPFLMAKMHYETFEYIIDH